MVDKYGTGQDQDCYPGTDTLINLLNIRDPAVLAEANHYCDLALEELIVATAELYAELNMVHPFREGNGRAQRILFEHIIVNCGWQISWETILPEEWVTANIAGVYADYGPMENIFSRCISESIS